ncbi:exo-beta-N-acetylmuramidase NamZ family protein [Sediminitomix flava]|uniref:Uncharacterized protein YbbC (DUF1343 family) n=1 Tax=Sediminitomix flava TaxID=379075 RepID=A0A315Z7L7_SEDFL|nr:DUF1343 domain-containing protein [Sediminitomix flava]PWJ40921.1 uncharacterized protein YbbC (DUF1343 family) [Sediminitomix flava]
MKNKFFLIGLCTFLFSFCTAPAQENKVDSPIVKVGLDVLVADEYTILQGKRVGLITNPTGGDYNFNSTVDIFFEHPAVELVALFGPEHGVRGSADAGSHIESYKDERTGLPVYSLYGKTRKPSNEMLEGIDVLVYDIQDIGVRSYTFISTLGLVMEAAAANNIEVVVLDRPNPLGGEKVEGNIVEEGYFSFVSQFPIPYVYGLTVGEVALMMNNEGWLKNGVKCKLTVVPMEGWKRNMSFKETGRRWVPTSPHIPFEHSAVMYPVTGILGELDANFIGIGYTMPFEVIGAEWIDPLAFAKALNSLELGGLLFRPMSFTPYYKAKKGTTLHGVQIYITDYEKAKLSEIQFYILQEHHKLYPEKDLFEMAPNRLSMFDKVCGSNFIRENFTKDYKFSDIKEYWYKDVDTFKTLSKKYYLYDE